MQEKNMYDIIIENITKEWYSSMIDNQLNNEWEVPKYSKKQIDKAGQILANKNSSQEEQRQALEILNNWRSSHAYPLQVITNNLRRNNPNAIVVQRLKRLESIKGKLERFPDMSLYRMQDLGGCRVIVNSLDQVYNSIEKFKNSRIRHELKRENDYIKTPKHSGYRSYHMVYKFQSESNDNYNKNMLIEIQFRTKLQHIWATAIEMMGVYTKTQLKAGFGDEDILRFFVLISSIFALEEESPVCPNTTDDYNLLLDEIKDIDNRLKIISKLSALSVAISHTDKIKTKNAKYYILILNYKEKRLKIKTLKASEVNLATKIYNKLEVNQDPDLDTVLVSATSFETVKNAYPNYFADISQFIDLMKKLNIY